MGVPRSTREKALIDYPSIRSDSGSVKVSLQPSCLVYGGASVILGTFYTAMFDRALAIESVFQAAAGFQSTATLRLTLGNE
jgi:hypothetical protein